MRVEIQQMPGIELARSLAPLLSPLDHLSFSDRRIATDEYFRFQEG